jgi:hypothetical protein
MAKTFTVEFDTSGKIVSVVDVDGKKTPYSGFVPLEKNPITNLRSVTITEVLVADSCYIHHNCQRIRVC